ncbi:MAG: type II secretion system F family protein [Alphaproteobacteria bacterium]|nr:type II secretion system F family protein [Alphaproteobacteria bacterium]
MPEIKKKSAFNKAMSTNNKWLLTYAKIICNLSNKKRLKIYRKLSALLRNRFSLMNALDMIYNGISEEGRKPNDSMAIAVSMWGRSLQEGHPFSDCLKGWAPSRERLMLSVGDVADLESALMNLIKVAEGSTRMIRPIINAVAYPIFLMMMSVLILYAIGVYMVPPMLSAAPNTVWTGTAKTLIDLSEWIQEHWKFAFSIIPVACIIIYATIGIWTGKVRVKFDRIPPWSLYKIFTGITWLLALSALVKGGVPLSVALTSLRRDSSRYLKERIDGALSFIKNGDNLGEALDASNFEFPDKQIIADLKIYSELDNFEEALDKLANEWLEESVYIIEQKSEIMNAVALLLISSIIAWTVFGTFDMQDQITTSMGRAR